MTKLPPSRRRSPFANPIVLLPLVLAFGAVVFYGVKWWHTAAAHDQERVNILAAVDVELAKDRPDSNELSHLMAAIDKLPDSGSASDLRAAQARIELQRGRPERADELFASIASAPAASAAEHRLGARILLRRAEAEVADAAIAAGRLRQVMSFAEHAYSDGNDPADLLLQWQAAKRLGDHGRAAQLAQQLAKDHADSKEAQLVQLAMAFKPEAGESPIDAVGAGFRVAPVEIDAMRVVAVLQQRDLRRAIELAEAVLTRAPGVFAARWAAAVVFHGAALGSAAGSSDRAAWVARRDAQLDWLLQRAPEDEPLRTTWTEWRRLH